MSRKCNSNCCDPCYSSNIIDDMWNVYSNGLSGNEDTKGKILVQDRANNKFCTIDSETITSGSGVSCQVVDLTTDTIEQQLLLNNYILIKLNNYDKESTIAVEITLLLPNASTSPENFIIEIIDQTNPIWYGEKGAKGVIGEYYIEPHPLIPKYQIQGTISETLPVNFIFGIGQRIKFINKDNKWVELSASYNTTLYDHYVLTANDNGGTNYPDNPRICVSNDIDVIPLNNDPLILNSYVFDPPPAISLDPVCPEKVSLKLYQGYSGNGNTVTYMDSRVILRTGIGGDQMFIEEFYNEQGAPPIGTNLSEFKISNGNEPDDPAGDEYFELTYFVNPIGTTTYRVKFGACVTGETLVKLADGSNKMIKNLIKNDQIYALSGNNMDQIIVANVENVLIHKGHKKLHKIMVNSSISELIITGNHPILIKDQNTSDNKYKWVEVDQINAGDQVYIYNHQGLLECASVISIIKDFTETDIVYNLKTSHGNYFANNILIHNKCLMEGSLIETPEGLIPVEQIKVGQHIWGQSKSGKTLTKVTHVYHKDTVLNSIPGKRLTPNTSVTINHYIYSHWAGIEDYIMAKNLDQNRFNDVQIYGRVYDLATDLGNYWCDGYLMK